MAVSTIQSITQHDKISQLSVHIDVASPPFSFFLYRCNVGGLPFDVEVKHPAMLLQNGTVVNDDRIIRADVVIKGD